MSEHSFRPVWRIAALLLAIGVAVSAAWGPRIAFGVAVGGVWNLASLWCLIRLVNAWLGTSPSRTRVVGWLLVKFPLLYLVAFAALWTRMIPAVGFGIGFSVVLLVTVLGVALRTNRFLLARPHGR